ncbi:MAG TPA: NAD(P)-dependent oxidoreductase [Solirubrobacteraceae bacterium]|nr:NAD(P)-dependent oxidoreductase [Solirubrobacteraceae bacterium]
MGSILVTGSSGHLGEALMRTLRADGVAAVGLDLAPGAFTDVVGSVADRALVREALDGASGVLHTATLHKPQVATRTREEFVRANVTGTLVLAEEAAAAGVEAFVFTSSTSAFGRALHPAAGEPAAWITEDVVDRPRNVYGVTKTAAEDLCELVHRDAGLPVVVLRTSRFFPEGDDLLDRRSEFDDLNLKVVELLHRRVDLADAVDAHRLALERAPALGFDRLVVSATTPLRREDAAELHADAPAVVSRRAPGWEDVFAARGWRMPGAIDRVYDNARARERLGWAPRHDFASALDALRRGEDPRSELARVIGAKGYAGSSELYAPDAAA